MLPREGCSYFSFLIRDAISSKWDGSIDLRIRRIRRPSNAESVHGAVESASQIPLLGQGGESDREFQLTRTFNCTLRVQAASNEAISSMWWVFGNWSNRVRVRSE